MCMYACSRTCGRSCMSLSVCVVCTCMCVGVDNVVGHTESQ